MREFSGKRMICLLAVAAAGFLSACGAEQSRETMLSVDRDGKVQNTIYEEFDKDYYSLDDLTDMVSDEISYYNSEYSSPRISMSSSELLDDGAVVKIVMNYDSSSDYSHFNQVSLFYGTVQEAIDNGYKISDNLIDKDGDKLSPLSVDEHLSKHIIISNEKVVIVAPYSIEYSTVGVGLTDKKKADLSNVIQDSVQLLLSK